MELVANDIRGLDAELMVVPWYSQTLKDIPAMYVAYNYGK
jgi:hypothetical protein